MSNLENQNTIFPLGDLASPDYFTGKVWWKPLMTDGDRFNILVGNLAQPFRIINN